MAKFKICCLSLSSSVRAKDQFESFDFFSSVCKNSCKDWKLAFDALFAAALHVPHCMQMSPIN
eukprot:08652.XXX_83053_83241_1 [CDS] Oithona nana genome sequencing.